MKQLGLLVGLAFSLCIMAGSASAQTTYLGEVCLIAGAEGATEDDGALLKLAFSDMGDQHYIVNGIELRDGGVPNHDSDMYNGNAEIVGSDVLMMLHSSRNDDDEISSGKFSIVLSISSLSGTLNGTTNYYDKNAEEGGVEYFEGVIEVVACPS